MTTCLRRALGVSILSTFIVPAALSPLYAAPGQPAEIYGDSGGRYFEYQCGQGQVLVGLAGSAGILIDNVQAVCGHVTADGHIVDAAPQGPTFGGARPRDGQAMCPVDYAVVAAWMFKNETFPKIGSIVMKCRELANRRDGGEVTIELRGSGNLEGYEFKSFIAIGGKDRGSGGSSGCKDYGLGIRGRADEQLAALGLICGAAEAEKFLNKHRRPEHQSDQAYGPGMSTSTDVPGAAPTLNLRKRPGQSTSSSVPGTERTLNKRRLPANSNPPPTDPPPSDPPMPGASLNSDGSIAPYEVQPLPDVSQLMAGNYSTTVTLRSERCLQPVSGTWQVVIPIESARVITIPLQNFSGLFAGPMQLQTNGTSLSQTVTVPLLIGALSVDERVNAVGAFSPDYESFRVTFGVNNVLCSVSGVIEGSKNKM